MSFGSTLTDDNYWVQYNELQRVKHQILQKYLGGWFPILSSWRGRVLYVDCCAGRGRHETGHEGSPILALRTLLNHRSRSAILSSTQVLFIFFENNHENCEILRNEVRRLGNPPRPVEVHIFEDNYERILREVIDNLNSRGAKLAPAFLFVDPYGFRLSMELLNTLLGFPQCEIFVNLMYRYVDMAIHNPTQASNMDTLFGSPSWRQLTDITDPEHRAEGTISFFSSQLHAEYVSAMRMFSTNNVLKYVLLHAANHRRGRELMKDAMWSVVPDGTFAASERNNPNQLVLIQPEPDLGLLKNRLWACFAGQEVSLETLYDWLVGELYRPPHLHDVLTEYRKSGTVLFNGGSGRVAWKDKPLIRFPPVRPTNS